MESNCQYGKSSTYCGTFHPETGHIISVSGIEKVDVILETAAVRGLMATTDSQSAITAAVHGEEVRLVLVI